MLSNRYLNVTNVALGIGKRITLETLSFFSEIGNVFLEAIKCGAHTYAGMLMKYFAIFQRIKSNIIITISVLR